MTPTKRPWYIEELEKHWGEGVMSFDTRRAAKTAIDQVEALTKERDEYAKAADTQAMAHKLERDELRMQIDSLCHEVDAIPAIKAERDTLAAAGKLALEALSVSYPTVRSRLRAHNKAIEELRQAGVQ